MTFSRYGAKTGQANQQIAASLSCTHTIIMCCGRVLRTLIMLADFPMKLSKQYSVFLKVVKERERERERERPPLWSSGQSFWLQIERSRVRFPALPDFLSGSGSGTGYTQPREPREVN